MKLAKAPAQIEREMNYDLDKTNVDHLAFAKKFFTAYYVVAAFLYFIVGIFLISTATQTIRSGYTTETITNSTQVATGIATLIAGPLTQVFLYLLTNLFISIAYDTKIIKYTMLYARENISDKNLKLPEELTSEQEYQMQEVNKQSQNINDE